MISNWQALYTPEECRECLLELLSVVEQKLADSTEDCLDDAMFLIGVMTKGASSLHGGLEVVTYDRELCETMIRVSGKMTQTNFAISSTEQREFKLAYVAHSQQQLFHELKVNGSSATQRLLVQHCKLICDQLSEEQVVRANQPTSVQWSPSPMFLLASGCFHGLISLILTEQTLDTLFGTGILKSLDRLRPVYVALRDQHDALLDFAQTSCVLTGAVLTGNSTSCCTS